MASTICQEGRSEPGSSPLRLIFLPDLPIQPRAGVGPIMLRGARRDAQHFGCFVVRHSDEIPQLHQFRLDFVLEGELVEGILDGEKLVVIQFVKIRAILSENAVRVPFPQACSSEIRGGPWLLRPASSSTRPLGRGGLFLRRVARESGGFHGCGACSQREPYPRAASGNAKTRSQKGKGI